MLRMILGSHLLIFCQFFITVRISKMTINFLNIKCKLYARITYSIIYIYIYINRTSIRARFLASMDRN